MRALCCLVSIFLIGAAQCAAAEPLKIGVILSLTGLAAEDGNNILYAARLAEDALNADRARVRLVVEDDRSLPKDTVAAYQKLKGQGVDAFIVGPYSFTTDTVIPLAARDRRVIFNSGGLNESFNHPAGGGFFFNSAISIEEDVQPFISYLRERPAQSAALVHVPSTWGRVQEQAYRRALLDRKTELVESVETLAQDNNADWGAVVSRLNARRVELVALLLNKNDIDLFLRKAAEQKYKAKFFGSKNAFDAFRLHAESGAYEGLCLTYPYLQLQRSERFRRAFTERFKEVPRIFADASYDTVGLLVRAHEIAQAQGVPLEQALRSVKYSGVVGEYRYSESRSFAISRSSLVCVEAGVLKHQNIEAPAS